jgi:hypothetical protein
MSASIALSQGYLVPNGITSSTYTNTGRTGIAIYQNPQQTDVTGFVLDPSGRVQPTFYTNSFTYMSVLDGGFRAFFVQSNSPVTLQAIQAGSYTELGDSTYVFNINAPFYIGVYAGYPDTFAANRTYPDPMFGWVELVNNRGTIQLLDSALAYGSGGIYAGTQTIIPLPEPGTLGLGLLGVGVFLCAHWFRRRSSELP